MRQPDDSSMLDWPNSGYGKWRGRWYAKTPNGHLGNLSNHEVTEHPDGTITVAPSILVSDNTGELFHGFLLRGVWTTL